jgi:hypothetical protein
VVRSQVNSGPLGFNFQHPGKPRSYHHGCGRLFWIIHTYSNTQLLPPPTHDNSGCINELTNALTGVPPLLPLFQHQIAMPISGPWTYGCGCFRGCIPCVEWSCRMITCKSGPLCNTCMTSKASRQLFLPCTTAFLVSSRLFPRQPSLLLGLLVHKGAPA